MIEQVLQLAEQLASEISRVTTLLEYEIEELTYQLEEAKEAKDLEWEQEILAEIEKYQDQIDQINCLL